MVQLQHFFPGDEFGFIMCYFNTKFKKKVTYKNRSNSPKDSKCA